MDLVIDGRTMAVSTPSGVPVTDIYLVLGDTVPMRIRVDHTLTDCTPALAVKRTIGSADLIMTVTGWTREDDWQTASWVVNTAPLQEALGSADSVALIAELVLVSPDGAQHTSRPIRVRVRRDILPTEYAPPAEVLANWEEMVAASLAAQLPDALHKAGMYVTPQGSTTTLATNMTPSHRRDVTYYRLPLNHRNIVGHLASSYTINSITLRANQSAVPVYVEVYKLVHDKYELLGRSLNAISPSDANQDYVWNFPSGMSVGRDDTIILRLVGEAGTDAVLTMAITQVGASSPESGADIVDGLVDPQRVINPDYPDIRYLLYVRIVVAYTNGVAVGGVELATKDHFDALTTTVTETGVQVAGDAQTASDAATAAQQALAAMPVDANGNITAQGGTFARTVNANGGVNIPVAPVTAGNAVNLAHLPLMVFAPCQPIIPLKSLWECYGNVEDTASGIHIKDVVAGAFGGVCTRVMQWSDYASTATILTVITLTGGNGANVLIDAAYNPNAGVSITPVTSPGTAFLPNAVQLSLFETRQDTTVTGRLVGLDGTVKQFSVAGQRDSHSCVYQLFLLETGGVIKFYLNKFTSGMFDGDADVLARPEYLAETTVSNNPKRFCFLGIAGIQGGEGNSFSSRIPVISCIQRFYGFWLNYLFPQP